ncbi:uncharacterized protein EI90DRAFT_2910618 [Cantharellus anzutake]|uniref:uncharacterized protein n=1 Tax=Cantharellus anzutake TaxID=1750568 RepID=UPI0019075D70|nr:uncharacterized protein EI90DRAFT_2910618 [Cantharellus anzutake]KAF8337600.1 hypothetical protein EI90DRAFT_2910618 [Cantharellus anzutake]
MSLTLNLNCWGVGDDVNRVFPVENLNTKSIGALKKAIRGEKQVALQHVDADALTLWKVAIPFDVFEEKKVGLEDERVLLSPVKTLSSIFSDQPDDQNLHIVVQFPLPPPIPPIPILELYCLIRDDDASHIFPVKIDSTEFVATLKKVIRGEKQVASQYVDADALTLWMVSIPFGGSFEENVKNAELKDEKTLSPVQRLSDIFLRPPQGEHLHIIVKPPRRSERI